MFIYKQWDEFCENLKDNDLVSVPSSVALKSKLNKPFLVLKHDVETNPLKALKLAQIENKYSHKGSYYVQAYLLKNKKNIKILKKIQDMGHEVSYHHDVMDSNKGDLSKAKEEFQKNIELFEKHGFIVNTVCQHGNPVIERNGYSSNRDFFRNTNISQEFKHICEIMVNFRKCINKEYKYISDAGYGWKIIFDPENNDIVNSSERDIKISSLDEVVNFAKNNSIIISTHPHRWHQNIISAKVKNIVFKFIKSTAKSMLKISFMKRLMGKFYYLAKKI